MSQTIQITIERDTASAALERISNGAVLGAALAGTMDRQNQLAIAHIQRDYLSLPKTGPTSLDGLRVISNRLRASINASPAVASPGGSVQSAIGSNVKYAAILEEGGDTKPHKITARNAKALHFGGMFRKSVNHPGSHIEGRHYIRRGITDRLPNYRAAMMRAIMQLAGGAA